MGVMHGKRGAAAPTGRFRRLICRLLPPSMCPDRPCTHPCPQGRRFSRPKRLNSYRQWVEQYAGDAERQGPQVAGSWLPRESGDDKLLDTIMLRLRLADGLDLRQLAAQHAQVGGGGRWARWLSRHTQACSSLARAWGAAGKCTGWEGQKHACSGLLTSPLPAVDGEAKHMVGALPAAASCRVAGRGGCEYMRLHAAVEC